MEKLYREFIMCIIESLSAQNQVKVIVYMAETNSAKNLNLYVVLIQSVLLPNLMISNWLCMAVVQGMNRD